VKEGWAKTLRWASIALCAAVLIICAVLVKWGELDLARFIGLVAVLAFFETWRIQTPWGRPLRLGMAVTLCVLAIRPLPEVVWIFFLGSMAGRAASRVIHTEEKSDFFHIVQRTYVVALAGLVYWLLINLRWDFSWNAYPPTYSGLTPSGVYFTYFNPAVLNRALVFPVALLVMAAVFYAGEALTSSVETAVELAGNWRVVLPQYLRQTFPAYLAIVGAGALMALYFPRIPWLSFLVFFFPLVVVRLESNRDKELDERYFQTMRVIGDAFDLARGIPGHSGRVSNLAAEVSREMGLSEEETRNLRYAAALHDIGSIEPEEEGEEADQGKRGAEVLESVPRLRPIADIVRYQQPRPGEGTGRIPTGSKIIRVVSDYDMLTNHPTKRLSSRQALEEMGVERGKLYDSKVLRTVAQVVEMQSRARRRPEREIKQKAKMLEEKVMEESLEEILKEDKE